MLRAVLLLGAALPLLATDPWTRLDALLPPTLRDRLPHVLRLAGDLCDIGAVEMPAEVGDDMHVVEHRPGARRRRYAVGRAAERLRRLRPGALAVYAGGWGNAPGDAAGRAVVAALLDAHPLVWELDVRPALGGGGYAAAALGVGRLAAAARALLRAAVDAGLGNRTHAVGFSLGAHAAGAAARAVRAAAGAALGRLTALDPARPCFARGAAAARWRLRATDAAAVHVLHSSGGAAGLARRLGTADVYVRGEGGGSGAGGVARAHAAAWREWVRRGAGARRCRGEGELRAGTCGGELLDVGYSCSADIRGIFLMESEKY